MAQPVRIQKIARLLQKVLGEIFVQETFRLLGNRIVTVTEVCISPDLGLAKVYLSLILNQDSADVLAKVEQHKGVIRKLLGDRIGNKLRKVPELRFYTDDSVMHAAKIHQLLNGLDIPEDAILMEHEELVL
jgi:ribosome-binding factor A